MTKQEAQMRLGAETIEVIVAEMGYNSLMEIEVLERYLNLIRCVSSHSMRQRSSYTLTDLQEIIDGWLEFESDIVDMVKHYIALYQEGA